MIRALLQQALDRLEQSRVFVTSKEKIKHPEGTEWYDETITAIREYLATEQEPVAYRHLMDDGWEYFDAPTGEDCTGCQALYTKEQI